MASPLPTTWVIAWRNLWRNRLRTSLALAAIGLSVALVLVFDGELRWESDMILETVTGPLLGHVQVHAPEWRRTRAMDKTIRNVDEAAAAVRSDPGVTGADVRIYAPALLALKEEGFAGVVLGLDIASAERSGRLLADVTGVPGDHEVFMGRSLAEQMGVTPGAEIAIVGQAVDGSLANDLYRVAQVVETPVDFVNRQAVLMGLDQAQALFAMPGEAHEIVVYSRDPEGAPALAARLARLPALAPLEVLDWETVQPAMADMVDLVQNVWIFVLLLVLIAAAAGVANTMLMATFERTHEFGMLLALGSAPSRIVHMIVAESLALGITGAFAGTLVGGALVWWAHQHGVDYAALTGGGPETLSAFGMRWSLRIYPRLEWIDVARAVGAVMATAVVASLWPAARAARLQPARALRE